MTSDDIAITTLEEIKLERVEDKIIKPVRPKGETEE